MVSRVLSLRLSQLVNLSVDLLFNPVDIHRCSPVYSLCPVLLLNLPVGPVLVPAHNLLVDLQCNLQAYQVVSQQDDLRSNLQACPPVSQVVTLRHSLPINQAVIPMSGLPLNQVVNLVSSQVVFPVHNLLVDLVLDPVYSLLRSLLCNQVCNPVEGHRLSPALCLRWNRQQFLLHNLWADHLSNRLDDPQFNLPESPQVSLLSVPVVNPQEDPHSSRLVVPRSSLLVCRHPGLLEDPLGNRLVSLADCPAVRQVVSLVSVLRRNPQVLLRHSPRAGPQCSLLESLLRSPLLDLAVSRLLSLR